MRMPSFTVVACTRPLALSTVITPSTERSDTAPLPPLTRALPCTVSTVTSAVVPSMVASRYVPDRFTGIQRGTVI